MFIKQVGMPPKKQNMH